MRYRDVKDSEIADRDLASLKFMLADGSWVGPFRIRRWKVGERFVDRRDVGVPSGYGIISITPVAGEIYKDCPVEAVILDYFEQDPIHRVRFTLDRKTAILARDRARNQVNARAAQDLARPNAAEAQRRLDEMQRREALAAMDIPDF